MTRSFYAVPALFCLTAAIVSAQAPAADRPTNYPPATQQPATPRPTTPPTSAQEPAKPSEMSTATANKVTYTGCVKPGTTAETWVLENAEVAQKAGASAPSTVGTSGSKMVFNLDPTATVNLKAHANHKVEVVGMVSPAKGSAGSTASAATPTGTAGTHAAHQQFSVESVKMVSATCP
jgi:hypothetical protein